MEKHVKVNLAWTFGLLLTIIVGLAAIRIPNPSRLADLVSFAAAIASLILAAFAIAQGVMSSSDAESSKIQAAEFNARTTTMLDLLIRQMPEISREIQRVGDRVTSNSTQFENQQPSISANGGAQDVKEPPDPQILSLEDTAKQIIVGASFAGRLAIEAACLSFEKKKPIKLSLLKEPGIRWYVVAYLVALGSVNWVRQEDLVFDESDAPSEIYVTWVHEKLVSTMPDIAALLDEAMTRYDADSLVPAARIALRGYFAEK